MLGKGAVEHRPAGRDLGGVPERRVLVGQEHQLAVAKPGLAAGVVEQHQREQAVHLGLVGHELRERPAEPDRLGREVAADGVALVEDQVDHREHGGEPVGQQVIGRHPEGDPGRGDLALRPHEPLGHRRLGHEEGAGDLGRLQAAERPQRQRDLRVDRERRVTAGEDELEPLVGEHRLVVHVVLHAFGHVEQAGLCGQRAIAVNAVDGPVAGHRREPCARVCGDAVARPALGGDRERLLRGLLGDVEVAEEADERSEDAAPLVPEGLVEDG